MSKFVRGNTYIVEGVDGSKYIVHQTGLKSWRAMIFTHVLKKDHWWALTCMEGNATSLYEKLAKQCRIADREFIVRRFNNDADLRRCMFNILKTGKFDG